MNTELGIIIVAGGSSARYGEKNKLLEKIGNIPIIAHSPMNFRKLCPEKQIIIVCHSDYIEIYKDFLNQYAPNNDFTFIEGGTARGDSVYNGLKFLKNTDVKYAAIHDAARPLASAELLTKCLEECISKGSAVAAKKVTDTIKMADENKMIAKTIDRSWLWAMETPQVFRLEEILAAYEFVNSIKLTVTDDASAMESVGKKVFLVENPQYNQKITYPWDLPMANFIFSSKSDF